MGEEAKYEGICLLFDGLQQPILNKQVGTLKVGRVCWSQFTPDPLLGKGARGNFSSPLLETFVSVLVLSSLLLLS